MSSIIVFVERSVGGAKSVVEKLVFELNNRKLIQKEGKSSQDPITFYLDPYNTFGYKILLPSGIKIIGVTQDHWVSTDPDEIDRILRTFQTLVERGQVLLSLEYPTQAGGSRCFKSINIYRI